MRKLVLFVAALAVFVLVGIATWVHVGTPIPTSAIAGPTDNAPVMTTGAKGPATWPDDDYRWAK